MSKALQRRPDMTARASVLILACMLIFIPRWAPAADGQHDRALEERITSLEKQVAYLKSRSIKVTDLEERITVIKREYGNYTLWLPKIQDAKSDLERDSLSRETGMMRQVIGLSIANLESELTVKIGGIRRIDALYILTSIFGVGFVLSITFYTIWMYLKRR